MIDYRAGLLGHRRAARRQGQADRRDGRRRVRDARVSRRLQPGDGKRLWRFKTIPAPGEPGGDTWPAGHYERGGGATWITGSYDPELNLLYWGVGNPESGLLRRQSPRRQPLYRLGRRARPRHRTPALALPVHAARRARLGFEPDPGARRSHDRRTRAQDAHHGESQRLLLRARSHERRVHPGQAVRDDDVGDGGGRQRPADRAAESAADAGGHAHVPRSGRRQQLHVAVVRPGAAPVLRVGARDLPGVCAAVRPGTTSSATW